MNLLDRAVLSGLPEGCTMEVSPDGTDLQASGPIPSALAFLEKFQSRLRMVGHLPFGKITVRVPVP